jgi:hypothetical protein
MVGSESAVTVAASTTSLHSLCDRKRALFNGLGHIILPWRIHYLRAAHREARYREARSRFSFLLPVSNNVSFISPSREIII